MLMSLSQLDAYRRSLTVYTDLLKNNMISDSNDHYHWFSKSIYNCIEGENNRNNLMKHYRQLLANHPDMTKNTPEKGLIIPINPNKNSSAPVLIFGVLIAASIVLLNRSPSEPAMRNTLKIMLNDAIELRRLYQVGWDKLVIQSNHFPKACNSVIKLIKSILLNQILTKELLYQASKNGQGSLNLALEDLSNFMFYKESLTYAEKKISDLNNQVDRINFIRMQAYKRNNIMHHLLRAYSPHISLDRHLLCQHLNISCLTMFIQPDGRLHLAREGRHTQMIVCTLVNSPHHSTLLLDLNIQKQVRFELYFKFAFHDLEQQLAIQGICYTPTSSSILSLLEPPQRVTKKHVQWRNEIVEVQNACPESIVVRESYVAKFSNCFFCCTSNRHQTVAPTSNGSEPHPVSY